MASLSVCLIAKNEADCIEGAIKSVRDIADQIVVIDTGSTDGTDEIARTAGAEVFSRPWSGSFAASRNESLAQATGDWILILDADEKLDQKSIPALRELMALPPAAYELKIKNYMDDMLEETASIHYTVRLFPNHIGLQYIGVIHEQIFCANPEHNVPRKWCQDVTILHYGYRHSVVQAKEKTQRNHDLLLKAIMQEPTNPFHHFNLAQTLSIAGDQEGALFELDRAISLLGCFDSAWRQTAWIQLLTLTYQIHGIEAAHQVLENYPDDCKENPDFWITLAHISEPMQAIACYERAASYKGKPVQGRSDASSSTWKPYLGIANIWLKLGQPETAYIYLTHAYRESPKNPLIRQQHRELHEILTPILRGA